MAHSIPFYYLTAHTWRIVLLTKYVFGLCTLLNAPVGRLRGRDGWVGMHTARLTCVLLRSSIVYDVLLWHYDLLLLYYDVLLCATAFVALLGAPIGFSYLKHTLLILCAWLAGSPVANVRT